MQIVYSVNSDRRVTGDCIVLYCKSRLDGKGTWDEKNQVTALAVPQQG